MIGAALTHQRCSKQDVEQQAEPSASASGSAVAPDGPARQHGRGGGRGQHRLGLDPALELLLTALVLGTEKTILFSANHGVIVVSRNIAEACNRPFYVERACQVQLYAMWTGQN